MPQPLPQRRRGEVHGHSAGAVVAEAARYAHACPHLVILSLAVDYDIQPGERCTLTLFVDDPT